jgi:hypothetical protein
MRTRRKRYSAEFKREALRRLSELEWPELADFCLTQCKMTGQDYRRQIGRHETRTPTHTKNQNNQSSRRRRDQFGGEFGNRASGGG